MIKNLSKNLTLKEEMIYEALLIIRTVDFLEAEVNKQLKLLEIAYNIDDQAGLIKAHATIKSLLNRLSKEQINMDAYMKKYGKLVDYEKEKILFDIRKKDEVYLRSVPKNKRRKEKR